MTVRNPSIAAISNILQGSIRIVITLAGKVTWNEFQKALSALGIEENEAIGQFERLDADGDGIISRRGICIWMKVTSRRRTNPVQNINDFSDSSTGHNPVRPAISRWCLFPIFHLTFVIWRQDWRFYMIASYVAKWKWCIYPWAMRNHLAIERMGCL